MSPGVLSPKELTARLAQHGVKRGDIGLQQLRAVTHYGVETACIDQSLAAAQKVMEAGNEST
jgi:hypothetical protein